MKAHGLEMVGKFIIQKKQTLPDWSVYFEGCFLFVVSEKSYYLGGLDSWIKLSAGLKNIQAHQLDVGLNKHQISSDSIPVNDKNNIYESSKNITDVLYGLAIGKNIQKNSIITEHIKDNMITVSKLLCGYNNDAINASSIPYKNTLDDLAKTSTIQETLDNILMSFPKIIRKKIQKTAWQYNPTEKEYVATLYFNSIKNDTIFIQCYDEFGNFIIPSKIKIDYELKRCLIWVPYVLFLNIIILG